MANRHGEIVISYDFHSNGTASVKAKINGKEIFNSTVGIVTTPAMVMEIILNHSGEALI